MEEEKGLQRPPETDGGGSALAEEDRRGPGWRAWVLSILVAIGLSVTATLLLGGSIAFRPEAAVPGTAGSGCGGPCLLGSAEPVAFTRVAAEKEAPTTPARGLRVWVGGIPDYSEERVGVTFSGVTPGSPAEKAGIQAGDVLVRFGDKEIRNIYDYTYALGERKPGDVVTLVVRREGKDVSLEITLGTRPGGNR